MGNLLGSPVTDKETHVGETDCGVKYGVSSMQGWRIHMEDAHICEPTLYALESPGNKLKLPGHSLFCVFDGHGGSYAAQYSGINLCRVLSKQPKFVQYAKFCQERPQKETSLNEAEKATYLRTGLELLEGALCDAFIDLDREILLALQGTLEPDAHEPYHPEPHSPTKEATTSTTPPSTPPSGTNSHANSIPQPVDDEDPGTTVVAVVVTPEWVVCANAGDSRAVFCKNGGKTVPLSYDHKPDDEVEERRIRQAGGYVAGGRVEGDLAVSRGLGDFRFKEPSTVLRGSARYDVNATSNAGEEDEDEEEEVQHVQDQKVTPVPDVIVQNRNKEDDQFIIIACDGIWDVQTNYEGVKMVADIFAEGESNLGLVCEEILDTCLMLGSKDNMTALVLQFEAQKIGEGGGVTARREARQETEKPNAEAKTAETEHT